MEQEGLITGVVTELGMGKALVCFRTVGFLEKEAHQTLSRFLTSLRVTALRRAQGALRAGCYAASGRKRGNDIAAFIFSRFRLELAARSRASGMEKPARTGYKHD